MKKEEDQHVHFYHNGKLIELHKRYATLQSKKQEKILDEWLYNSISRAKFAQIGRYTFPIFEDILNGLIILTHINQHLEEGLGLRHIIDWVMYVKHSIPNTKWISFKTRTDQLGLTVLAKTVTRLGQMYLGLPESISWCKDVPARLVEDLLDYVFECGNFGHKDPYNNTIIMVMSHGRGVNGFFRNLQNRGKINWALSKDFPFLIPFAWLYQLIRYLRLGFKYSGL